MKDNRGTERGKCKKCAHCTEYNPPDSGHKCSVCNCPAAAHDNLDSPPSCGPPKRTKKAWTDDDSESDYDSDDEQSTKLMSQSVQYSGQPVLSLYQPCVSLCSVPGCNQGVGFDMNTGAEYKYCSYHLQAPQSHSMYVTDCEGMQLEDIELSVDPYTQAMMYTQAAMMAQSFQQDTSSYTGINQYFPAATLPTQYDQAGLPQPMSQQLPPGVKKCAIQECPNPCYVDDSGTVHECCGYTHAMEHQRRQALWQQVNQQVVKGVTHCYLPGCNRPTWPFHNYCGKTHADQGKLMGLPPPPSLATHSAQPTATSGPKDSSMCIIPECYRKKYVDPQSGVTHDYCGKTHAQEGARRGIRATADKVEDRCELPGCTNKKRTEGTRVHNYCCLDHAQKDAPNRDARILSSDSQVQSFLKQFSNLNVVSIDENPHAKPGGTLFQKFKKAYDSLPSNQHQTQLAFHGTSTTNIDSICKNGYDPGRRRGQAYGAGEYFATTPDTSLSYCQGGKKMLLNELLLGQAGTHHTQHGNIIVMKNPDHDLPRFVITFK